MSELRLHLVVDYDLYSDASLVDMAANLEHMVYQAIGNGMLTGETDAEVKSYTLDVLGSPPEPNGAPEALAAAALAHVRQARDLLKAAGATRALERIRGVLPSVEGAVRAAGYRERRERRA